MLLERGESPGMLKPWAKRFYVRGMAQLARAPRTVLTRQGLRDRHPELHEGVRAWRAGVAIYPPESWPVHAKWLRRPAAAAPRYYQVFCHEHRCMERVLDLHAYRPPSRVARAAPIAVGELLGGGG